MLKLYLDTSAILKRYITEPGTNVIDSVFEKAETGELAIVFSLWNIGEALGVLDEKRRRGWLTQEEFERALNLFADEMVKLLRLKTLEILPVQTQILISTWKLLMDYNIYEADALQIATCLTIQSDSLLTSDEKLALISTKAGLKTINLLKDENQLKVLINKKENNS